MIELNGEVDMVLTWVDWIIIAVVFYFAVRGWSQGLWYLAASLISFFLSLWFALRLEPLVVPFLTQKFGLSEAWAGVVSYAGIALITEAILSELFNRFLVSLPRKVVEGELSQVLGAILSAINGLLFVTFFLVLLMALPVRGTIRQDINKSVIAPRLLNLADRYGGKIRMQIESSADELAQFLTIKPESTERVSLDAQVQEKDLTVDQASERQMVVLVNQERTSRGIPALAVDDRMRLVARDYSKAMLLGRFFSHIDNEGHDAAYRLEQGGVQFMIAGENLAYAPSLSIAHKGLMNSEGHRRNILDSKFHRVGIGVIDAGPWGKMFTQEFAD